MLRAEAHREKKKGGSQNDGVNEMQAAPFAHNIYTQSSSSMKSEPEIGVESQYWERQTGGIRS